MTHYMISLRSHRVGGGVAPPGFLSGDATAAGGKMTPVSEQAMQSLLRGKDVIFATHGFNVNYEDGLLALGRLADNLALGARWQFVGILWPGDFWVPAINYPWEASDAVTCGNHIARLCNGMFSQAASFSFISHSLGGRVILQAATRIPKVKMLCLTAAAVDSDVLSSKQYAAAYANSEKVYVLSSRKDKVLRYAYPAGDFFSDIFGDDDSPFRGALGRKGPRPFPSGGHAVHDPIPNEAAYDHGHYLPSSSGDRWKKVAAYMKAAVLGEHPVWP